MRALVGWASALLFCFAVGAGLAAYKQMRQDSAKCTSLDGVYGGGKCYVRGIELDLRK